MSRDAHRERVVRRVITRLQYRELSTESLIVELVTLLCMIGNGVAFRLAEGVLGQEDLLIQIATKVEELKAECQKDYPSLQRIWEHLRALFDESYHKNLWPRGIIIVTGNPDQIRQFRANSTVIWEVINERFTGRKRRR